MLYRSRCACVPRITQDKTRPNIKMHDLVYRKLWRSRLLIDVDIILLTMYHISWPLVDLLLSIELSSTVFLYLKKKLQNFGHSNRFIFHAMPLKFTISFKDTKFLVHLNIMPGGAVQLILCTYVHIDLGRKNKFFTNYYVKKIFVLVWKWTDVFFKERNAIKTKKITNFYCISNKNSLELFVVSL